MEESLAVERLVDEKNLIAEWMHRWGGCVSEIALDPDFNYFRLPHVDGLIGYRMESNCAVVYGDPICPVEDAPLLAQAFHQYCQEKGINYIYIVASKWFAKWAVQNLGSVMIEVGEELIFDPYTEPKKGHKGYRLRNRIKHALHLGVSVHEYTSQDIELERSIQQVEASWLKGRRGPQIYLGKVDFFDDRTDKRWFYVKNSEGVIGTALLSRLEAKQGWLLKCMVTIPEAPRGTSELLMMTILETLSGEGCRYLTYGMVPAERLGEMAGIGKFSAWIAQGAFRIARWIFHLDQRKTYWQKFLPKTEKSYLLFGTQNLGLQEIRTVLKVLKIDYI